uniref:NopRA1 domain-containing protein n=1 Tax=Syphacia muris TaxID=451379 RepID=A0A0N5A8Z1_9BILA
MDQDVVTDLLTMYGASVSNTDEYIFDILYHLERTYHLNFGRVAPLVFGEKSVSNYHNLRRYGLAIHNRLTPDQVLDFVDPKLLWYTLLKLRDGQSSSVVELQPNVSIKKDTPYDVRYILRLFISILDDGSEVSVSCRKFVECNGLSLAFASLSLHSKASRALAYTVLFRYSQRLSDLSTEVFPERPFYVYLLKFFRNSVEIVSHFMARVCKLLLHPEDPVFQPIMSFLVLKPTLDLTNIPEFYKLLMSSSTEHNAEERQWILKLLADSMLEPNDYNILQKRYGIKFCLSLFTSCISEHMSRKYILFMLSAALKHPTVAYDLFYRQNLQCWIALTMQQPWLQRWEACFLCHLFVTLMEHFKVKFHKPELKHEGFSYQLQTKICKLLSEKVVFLLFIKIIEYSYFI